MVVGISVGVNVDAEDVADFPAPTSRDAVVDVDKGVVIVVVVVANVDKGVEVVDAVVDFDGVAIDEGVQEGVDVNGGVTAFPASASTDGDEVVGDGGGVDVSSSGG